MKKIMALALALSMSLTLAACGGGGQTSANKSSGSSEPAVSTPAPATNDGKNTLYVLGPTPDHGWTAQAGAYAQAKCDEITKAGQYKAVYMPASSGEEQVDQCNTIIANGDAAEVVMMALDDSAQAGQEALYAEGIPFISFDRIIEATEKYAILNASGDNWQCGAGIAYWLQKNGMQPGDTVVVLYGDNGTVCSRRQEGFEQFLKGEIEYQDKQTAATRPPRPGLRSSWTPSSTATPWCATGPLTAPTTTSSRSSTRSWPPPRPTTASCTSTPWTTR